MKFLHVTIPSKRMMETYIKMIRDHYGVEDHTFYFLGKCPPSQRDLFEYGNVIELQDGKNKLDKIRNFYMDLQKYDFIIWHGLVLSPKFALFLFVFRKFLKKSAWVMWGIDLYEFKRNQSGLKTKIINYINYNIRKNIPYPIAIFPTDIYMYSDIFENKTTEVSYAPYPIRKSVFYEMENLGEFQPRKNGEVWIQVGNNANSFNNHLDILQKLAKFANEKIKIFIPLSYGNDWHNKENDYIDIVWKRAIDLFGEEKVVVLKNLMTIEEYSKFLEQIDIMIIATNRQNALGNILKNMYSGGKVYLSKNNILYKYFNDIGIKILKYEDIDKMSFEEFVLRVNNNYVKSWMIDNQYPEMNLLFWEKIFCSQGYHYDGYKFDEVEKGKLKSDIIKKIKKEATVHEKKNYVNYQKYQFKNKKILQKLKLAKDIFIVGHDDSCIKIIQNIKHENNIKYRWNIMGIISDEMIDLEDKAYGINTVSTIFNCKDYNSIKCINFIDKPELREYYYNIIHSNGGNFENLVQHNTSIGYDFVYQEAFFLGSNSIIGHSCKFGKFVKVGHNVVVGCNCVFGDYVTIGDNQVITDGTTIADYTVLK